VDHEEKKFAYKRKPPQEAFGDRGSGGKRNEVGLSKGKPVSGTGVFPKKKF